MPDRPALVADAMRTRIVSCTLRTPLSEVARRLREEGVRAMIVASAGSDLVAGTVSDLDLLRAHVEGRSGDAMASDVMSMATVATVTATDLLDVAAARLAEAGVDLVLVVDGQPARPVGTLSHADLAAFMAAG